MVFVPFVVDSDDTHVTVDIHRMRMSEAEQTNHVPPWQTSWTSDYLMVDHYVKDFGAVRLPSFSGAPRLLIADEAAKNIFFTYLR